MNWDAIAAVAVVAGAITIIVTLAYLALQIRQNTAALQSTATQGAHDQVSEFYRTLSTDPELIMIIARGCQNPDELSEAELGQFYSFHMLAMFNLQNWYLQTQDKLMDDALLSSWSRIVTGFSGTPGFKQFWDERGYIYSPKFSEYLETTVFTQTRHPKFKPLGVDLGE